MVRHLLFSSALFLTSATAVADGVQLKNGRYDGPVMTFDLTKKQKAVIDHFRACHLERFKTMNEYTPYVFMLTREQAKTLKAKSGFAPRYFNVYETYTGYNDAGPHWNLVLRFSENQIEVPLDLLVSNREAMQAQKAQGWKPTNPCFPKLGKVTLNTLLDASALQRRSA
jgi:hypothetical protein